MEMCPGGIACCFQFYFKVGIYYTLNKKDFKAHGSNTTIFKTDISFLTLLGDFLHTPVLPLYRFYPATAAHNNLPGCCLPGCAYLYNPVYCGNQCQVFL